MGTSLALISGIGGAIGTFAGGFFADRLARNDKRWYMWIASIPSAINVPLILAAVMLPDPNMALVCLFFGVMIGGFYLGPVIAMAHALVRPSMRAMASAVLFLILNLIGLGMGPLCVGLLSDAFAPSFGSESLRYAMAVMSFINIAAAVFFALAARKLIADLKLNS